MQLGRDARQDCMLDHIAGGAESIRGLRGDGLDGDILALVDTSTGEQVGTLMPGDRIIPRKVMAKIENQDGKDERIRFAPESWGKAYDGAWQKLASLKLSAAEYQMILFMLPLVKIGSGLLVYGNWRPVQLDYIMGELHLSAKTAQKVVQRLVNLRILYRGESGKAFQYFFNPYIYSRGGYINATLRDMFKDSVWAQAENPRKSKTGHSVRIARNPKNA